MSSSQSASDNEVFTKIAFDTEDWDTDSWIMIHQTTDLQFHLVKLVNIMFFMLNTGVDGIDDQAQVNLVRLKYKNGTREDKTNYMGDFSV